MTDGWDESLLHLALQAARCYHASSTGYAHAELLLERSMVYPMELDQNEVDIEGTELTQPLADALIVIHNETIGKNGRTIKKLQERYLRAYDKKHKTNRLKLRNGSKVQLYDYSGKRSVNYKKGAMKAQWSGSRLEAIFAFTQSIVKREW